MRDPHRFILKFGAVDALCFRTVVSNDDFTALHFDSRLDFVERPCTIVQVHTPFSRAKSSKVFDCSWHLILEKFDHYAPLLETFLPLCSYLDVHEDLNVSNVELGHVISAFGPLHISI